KAYDTEHSYEEKYCTKIITDSNLSNFTNPETTVITDVKAIMLYTGICGLQLLITKPEIIIDKMIAPTIAL
ncbi:MAG: hypothetical protein QXI85_04520, partial [Desulfurococcaceae archaeon]